MKRTLIACAAVIACGAGLAVAASPEVDKAIKTLQSAAADPAKLKLFCVAEDDDEEEENAKDAKAEKAEKEDPAEEKAAEAALKQLGGDVAAALAVGEKLAENSPDATEFASALEAIQAKCPQ